MRPSMFNVIGFYGCAFIVTMVFAVSWLYPQFDTAAAIFFVTVALIAGLITVVALFLGLSRTLASNHHFGGEVNAVASDVQQGERVDEAAGKLRGLYSKLARERCTFAYDLLLIALGFTLLVVPYFPMPAQLPANGVKLEGGGFAVLLMGTLELGMSMIFYSKKRRWDRATDEQIIAWLKRKSGK